MEPLHLHSRHAAQGALFGERGGREVVLSYGEPAVEYAAASAGAALVDLSARGVIGLRGEDRVSFLHGMVTQDIKGLPELAQSYTALLTVKGAMVADARVFKREDSLLLDVEPGTTAAVLEFLNKHLISEDAELEDLSNAFGHLLVLGPRAEAALAAAALGELPAVGHFRSVGEGALLFRADPGLQGGELLVPHVELEALFERLAGVSGVTPVGLEALEVVRVEAGVPRYSADMDEKTIPLEANLGRALHYQKGCYIGQEVIARATFRGQVARKLVGLLLGTGSPAPRTELRVGERKAGFVTTVVHSPALQQNVALGYVHRDFLEPGTKVELLGGGEAIVAALPLVAR